MRVVAIIAATLLLLASIPPGNSQQGGIQINAEVKLEVTPLGFLFMNTTITLKAVNDTATIPRLSIEYPLKMLDMMLKRGQTALLSSRIIPRLADASVKLDMAESYSRNRTFFELDPGSNPVLLADQEVTISFWFYLKNAIKPASPISKSYSITVMQPAVKDIVNRFEFKLVVPSGLKPAPPFKFDSVSKLDDKTIHVNTTSRILLREPMERVVMVNGTEPAGISIIKIPFFERRLVITETGSLLVKEAIELENQGGATLDFLPLSPPGKTTRLVVLPPPPPYPGFEYNVRILEGKLNLKNISKSLSPKGKLFLSYQYASPSDVIRIKPNFIEITLPLRLPLPGVADTAIVGMEAPWHPSPPPRRITALSDLEEEEFSTTVNIPLAAGASSIVGAGLIAFLAILFGAMVLPQLSPATAIRRRIPQLQEIIGERLQLDKELMQRVQEFLKGKTTLDDIRRLLARIRNQHDVLLKKWADLRAVLAAEKELPIEKLSHIEKAYERSIVEQLNLFDQLSRGTIGREAFERQWASLSKRIDRQGHDLKGAFDALISKMREKMQER